jgi:hypothetical protein
MEEIHVVPPQHGMLVTNISRLPMQSLDFGAGLPTALRTLSSTQRAAAILQAEDGVEHRVFHPLAPSQYATKALRPLFVLPSHSFAQDLEDQFVHR